MNLYEIGERLENSTSATEVRGLGENDLSSAYTDGSLTLIEIQK